MRRQAWRLGDHGAVYIGDLPALRAYGLRRTGKQHARISALPTRIGVGKMATDVAQRRGAEQGIGDGVQQHIGIRVPEQPCHVVNVHAADHQ